MTKEESHFGMHGFGGSTLTSATQSSVTRWPIAGCWKFRDGSCGGSFAARLWLITVLSRDDPDSLPRELRHLRPKTVAVGRALVGRFWRAVAILGFRVSPGSNAAGKTESGTPRVGE